jgi:hypothetical protein
MPKGCYGRYNESNPENGKGEESERNPRRASIQGGLSMQKILGNYMETKGVELSPRLVKMLRSFRVENIAS